MEILAVEDLTFSYPHCVNPAVKDISFKIEKGEFVVLCGATGSGKSTLLRMLKRELTPLGKLNGKVLFQGNNISSLDERTSAARIGFVMQQPEQQIVTDKVWHELAFGLENLGVPRDEIARRTAEMASYFGIGDWYDKDVSELSGGQKQLLNLAAVLVMKPDILILDEPTAQLDPIAASDFIAALKRLNQEMSLTMIMAEHHLEEVVPICDKLMIMDSGTIIANGAPEKVITEIRGRKELLCGMPAAARLFTEMERNGNCPLTVRQGRKYIENNYLSIIRSLPEENYTIPSEHAMTLKDVWFRYEQNSRDIIKGLDLTIGTGEIFCILGGNGSGKTTTLNAVAGILKPYKGTIRIFGKKLKEYKNRSLYHECLALLPQDVQTTFLHNTVREELSECGADVSDLPFDISHLLDKHPYDLSGGEQQLTALAKVLASKPRLLLLDEPTKGLDANSKSSIFEILGRLKTNGVTTVIVTHDVEFAAECADRCAMFFCGQIVSVGTPREFFSSNNFYTTAVSRMTRDFYDEAVTIDDVTDLCRQNRKKEGE